MYHHRVANNFDETKKKLITQSQSELKKVTGWSSVGTAQTQTSVTIPPMKVLD